MIKTKNNSKLIVNISLLLFFITCVFMPICSMLRRITKENFIATIYDEQFINAVYNSLSTTFVATIISIILALIAAWSIERINIKFKSLFSLIFTIPMLVPSISHSFGLISLFGSNGIITNMLNIDISIYGFNGILIGSIMYSFPVAFLMFSNILKYEDGLQYKAAQVLAIPKFNQFISITIPYIKKTLISAFFSVFTMIITDYGVPLMIGGKTVTLSVLMYNKAIGLIDYDTSSVIGSLLLVPAIVAFIVDILNGENTNNNYITNEVEQNNNKIAKVLSYIICIIICCLILAPILSFVFMTFETKYPINTTFTLKHIQKTIKKGGLEYLSNSLVYSLLTALLGTIVAFVSAYMNSRLKGKFSNLLHLISIVSMAIPGIVLGLSYVIYFHDKSIYGTILLIVVVCSIHFFSSPYLMAFNSFNKLNPNLENVCISLGVKKINIMIDIIIPKMKNTIVEMFSYFFVNTMMTISAVSFLAPPSPKTLSLMINQFEAQLLMESAAFVSIVILSINLVVKIIFKFINNDIKKRKFKEELNR